MRIEPRDLERLRKLVLDKLRMPRLTAERAFLVTQSYRQTEGKPAILRRALALEWVLRHMSIYIEDYELLVGGLGPEPFSCPVYPEYSWRWVLEEMDDFSSRDGDRFRVEPRDRQILEDILPYWEGKAVEDVARSMFTEAILQARESRLVALENMLISGVGHYIPNYPKVLKHGLAYFAREAEERIKATDLSDPDGVERRLFYQAVRICAQAVIGFAKRYAALAQEMAEKTSSASRRAELQQIAEICSRVPAYPPSGLWEALQALWFIHLVAYIDQNGLAVTLGHLDQYLYPYYRKDIQEGRLTREEARILIENFLIKCNEIIKLYNNLAASYYAGFPITQAPQLGGFTPEGGDAANELSELILEAEANVRLPQPDIAVLCTPSTPEDFLVKACRIVPLSMKPKFFNADVGLKALLSLGVPLEDARDWAFVGCVENSVPGKTWGQHNAAMVNLGKCLELALFGGKDYRTGKLLGEPTRPLGEITDFNEFLEAFCRQVARAVRTAVSALHIIEKAHAEIAPLPYASLLVEDCLEKARDPNAGGARYNFTGLQGVGLATVADSLVALKKLVFEEKKITKAELLTALTTNFREASHIRQELLQAPKFGNDHDEVDQLAAKVVQWFSQEVLRYRNRRGGRFIPGFFSVSTHVPFGKGVITVDGRTWDDPLSDACSPAQGRARRGPTGVARSVAKLDSVLAANGTLLNVKFPASALKGEEKLRKLAQYIRTYFSLGGFHLQINVVDVAQLRRAQENPELYPDLLVRVAAYVALFTQLSKEVQEEIIRRSELEL